MKELLECKDLLKHKRVEAAYEGLIGDTYMLTINEPSWLLLPAVAFAMRDALCPEDLRWMWEKEVADLCEPMQLPAESALSYALRHGEAKHWIVAAVKVWEASNAEDK